MNLNQFIFTKLENIDTEKYFFVDYYIKAKTNLFEAAKEIAIGQSIGNPNIRSKWENNKLINDHCARVNIINNFHLNQLQENREGIIRVYFPLINIDFNEDGISHLLCIILGGQTDIDNLEKCNVINIQLPSQAELYFKKPKYGLSGIRKFCKINDKPLLGGIVKPKTGMSLYDLEEITKELIDGGINFIKEDEIIASPNFLPLKERVKAVSKIITNKNVIFCHCINSDPINLKNKVETVYNNGGNGIHINIWSGLGCYKSIRDMDLPLFLHYQKSGEKTFTHRNNPYNLNSNVLAYLAYLCGVDTIHVGMIGGYSNSDLLEIKEVIKFLQDKNITPALSCGLNAQNVNDITKAIGIDYLANSGGAIHGHPQGTKAGVIEIKNAIDNFKHENE